MEGRRAGTTRRPDSSRALRAAIFAESARAEERRRLARSVGTITSTLDSLADQAVARFTPASTRDDRQFAPDREPCPRCGTRGDIGCRHRRPSESSEIHQSDGAA
ncbi:hypothetical protein [Novosphingobium album (ex Liu et al. 2023)]|uniref:Uncharacterized protein n=1 Tax=Novosphingobium album (ex Liu et al. 2023) TaxID=3031130 RepID=A0ABT5WY15_9SPHN|nr:hypothetical protein [Novosphingobium album (ex Liu et al. 2023)]MDE8654806.1 hypothetical protein [Novosphingobium album (ex Liu et al. 2023)]